MEKNWNDFYNTTKDKKLILYGINNNLDYLWLRGNKSFEIIAAVDNDPRKNGHVLSDFFDEKDLGEAKNIKIQSKECLMNYDPKESIILISAIRSYKDIASDLAKRGFVNFYSISNMENMYREEIKENGSNIKTLEDYRHDYAVECVKKHPIQNNKIVFTGTSGYADHEKYIIEQLLSLNSNLDIVCLMDREFLNVPNNIRVVYKTKWKQYIYEMETAKVWLFDNTVPSYIIKRENQIYIQTKHWGSITLKKFYLDEARQFKSKIDQLKLVNSEKEFKQNGERMDYIISGSEFDEKSCRSGFGFNGKFLRFGSPRSDGMFNSQKYKIKVFDYFNLKSNEHILIYAPTYRIHSKQEYFFDLNWQGLDFELLQKSLIKKWKGIWKILLRLHPSTRRKSDRIEKPDFVLDASDYDDSQELLAASDILISDFSSIMFEPAYVLKPVFLYAPDKETYTKNDRDLLLDYDSLPFPISTTNEELSKQILDFNETIYKQGVQSFLDKYGVHEDGHASERSAKFINELLSN